jgi:DNA repair protein RadA/Sms
VKTVRNSIPLASIKREETVRLPTGNEEIDRVLGGGLMRGSSVLFGGEPGIGKSTLMLQLAAGLGTRGRVLYVTGEESAGQIRIRADRLRIDTERIEVLCETDLTGIVEVLDKIKPVLIVVDSIQTISHREVDASPGSVSQLKACTQELNDYVKEKGTGLFLIGHVTKEGVIAGPKLIEHLVDTVLYFEQTGTEIRLLRAAKNRFGATEELGIFQMTAEGLIPVQNPSVLFLDHRTGDVPAGMAVAPIYEGSRVLLVEIQSLVVPAKGGVSRVFSDRIDSRRVSRMAAVLEKHLKMPFSDLDVYVNVAGGMRVDEVGIDLALAAALYSAKRNLPLEARTAIIGEVSLAGEVRGVPNIDRRIRAARELSFRRLIGPVRSGDALPEEPPDESGRSGKTREEPFYNGFRDIREVFRSVFGGSSEK